MHAIACARGALSDKLRQEILAKQFGCIYDHLDNLQEMGASREELVYLLEQIRTENVAQDNDIEEECIRGLDVVTGWHSHPMKWDTDR